MDLRISRGINCAKAIAILFVIVAHTNFGYLPATLGMVLDRIGSMGVPIFMLISGYLFNTEKYDSIIAFFKKKVFSIFIPWFFCGFIIYVYSNIVVNKYINIIDAVKFLLGKGSYLYYMTVLVVSYILLFYPVKQKHKSFLYISIAVTIVSHQLTAWGIIDIFGNYLNVFNWIGIFSIGVLARDIDINLLIEKTHKNKWYLLFVWAAMLILGFFIEDNTYGYFSKLGLFIEFISSILIICFSVCYGNKYIEVVGRYSFSIYLTHIAIIPIAYKFLGHIYIINLLMPIFTLLICVLIIYVGKIIFEKLKIERIYSILIGLR